MLFYQQTKEQLQQTLHTNDNGLSRQAVKQKQESHGLNAILLKGEPLWRKLVEPFANVFMLVLFIAVVISFLHHAIFDAVIILVIMATSALIYYVQRFSTERILASLQKHTAQQVEVIRGGESHSIDATQLVPGDIILLNEGDKVPADIRITQADALRADEAVLTGESVPVSKYAEVLAGKKEVYEQTNILFSGSFIVGGTAKGIVVATGNSTEFGRIATLTNKAPGGVSSPVQEKIDKLISYIIAAVAAIAIVAFLLALSRGIELTEAFRFVIALSVSAVPESLPVAISVILALGMRRMAKKKALVRNMRAIETIGVITTIATDKTGTLTENKLSVQETWQLEGTPHHLPTIAHRTINHHSEKTRDPLDVAMIEFTAAEASVELKGSPIAKLPFDQAVAMSGNVWHHKGQHDLVIKGAPESVIARSHLTATQKKEVEAALQNLTSQGYRVIALASAPIDGPVGSFAELHTKLKFHFVGLLAVSDTLRPQARSAIAAAQNAGVTVRMITGDHFETAYSIGKKLGLAENRDQVFDSRLMSDMTDKELTARIADTRVFSRVTPENKFRILQVLNLTEVTAMTGDGVNDVPALANAAVGVAMGSGSQIAKDAGSIVLLNDNFSSIVKAMREGRIIFSNIRRMLFYLLSTNAGEVITAVGALIVGLPMPLAPVQILWINLVTDTTMVIPLGLEPGEKDVMKQKPIPPKAPILSRYMISRIALVALAMGALSLCLYAFYSASDSTPYAQTIVFTALVVMQWANAFNARSTYESIFTRSKVMSKAFYIGLAISIILQVVAILGPLQGMLHIHPVMFSDLFITGAVSFVFIILVVEIHKFFGRRFIKNPIE